jgi:hypothetical protein
MKTFILLFILYDVFCPLFVAGRGGSVSPLLPVGRFRPLSTGDVALFLLSENVLSKKKHWQISF